MATNKTNKTKQKGQAQTSKRKKRPVLRLSAGVDIGKNKHRVAIGATDAQGQFWIVRSRGFDNTPSGRRDLATYLATNFGKYPEAQKFPQVVLEATGTYHEEVLDELYAGGLKVCLVLASAARHFARSHNLLTKTDKVDANMLAQMGAERVLMAYKPFSSNLLELRTLLRIRRSLVEQRTANLNRCGMLKSGRQTDEQLWSSYRRIVTVLSEEIERIEQQVQKLYAEDEQLRPKVERLCEQVPGLAWLSVLTIIAETNGFDQIDSIKQLTSYAGLDVIQKESGQFKGKTRISKRGNRYLRAVMYMCTRSHLNAKAGNIYQCFARVRQRNPKAYKIAHVAAQRKLLALVYTLFKNGADYVADHRPQLNYAEGELKRLQTQNQRAVEYLERTEQNKKKYSQKNSPEPSSGLREITCEQVSLSKQN